MKIRKKSLGRYLLILILFLLAVLSARFYFGNAEYRFLRNRVENIAGRKVDRMLAAMQSVAAADLSDTGLVKLSGTIDFRSLSRQGIKILVFSNDSLVFWSDKSPDIPSDFPGLAGKSRLLFIQNGYFIVRKIETSDKVVAGLLRVYSRYDFGNSLVRSGFPPFFGLPDDAVLIPTPEVSDYHIYDREGDYLFSVGFPAEKENSFLIILPLLTWSLFLLMLLLVADDLMMVVIRRWGKVSGVAVRLIIYLSVWTLAVTDLFPSVFYRTMLFDEAWFSIGRLIPSMGHLLVTSILLADFARTLFLIWVPPSRDNENTSRDFLNFTLLLLPGTVLLILFHQVLNAMISHTNLVFEGYRVSEANILSVAGIGSLFLLIMVPGLYLYRISSVFRELKLWAFIAGVLINLMLFADFALFGIRSGIVLALFFLFLVLLLRIFIRSKYGLYSLSASFSILFSLYLTWYITTISARNESDSLKVSAVTLASSHDPVAENLLLSLSPDLTGDTILKEIMESEFLSGEEAAKVSEYLMDNYFGGYWANYDLSFVLCNQASSLLIDGGGQMVENCFRFFEEMAASQGEAIEGTPFYFIENSTGRPSYLGFLYYGLPGGGRNGVFIEMFSYVNAFREGYPELLTDENYLRPVRFRQYSMAKYIEGNLVLNTGSYSYPIRDADLSTATDEFMRLRIKGYDHFIYRQGEITIVQSRRAVPFISRVVSFAYIYIFIQLAAGLLALWFSRLKGHKAISLTFRQKLQAAFALIILITFTGIAAGTTYLSIEQYRQRHYDSLREKANSLYIELEHKLENEARLDPAWSDGKYMSLNELLVKFSNVFFTDINLYDSTGELLATSRPEIFIRDLTGMRMDRIALASLSGLSETEYIASERIGELEYLSIYVPFYNVDNELLAYLNIPYFGMQTALSTETTNLIVAIINFSLLMIIAALSVAVLLSERITAPIRMLGQVLSSVRLGKKSRRLEYPAGDEIGELVRQYNTMVEELEASTLKLAASEREYAWREMAKQIAHEIKNPLTPMKLNVQQLEKAWRDNRPGFEKKLEKFTRNQIEYIDILSSIATAFSNFARMPGANPSQVDLLDQVKTTLELFKNSGNVGFRIVCPQTTRIIVMADREHLNSIFSNLVKNAIQAIPAGKTGLVKVSIELAGDRVLIRISDNGTGIPEEFREKMFTPHFTTKSSGSGLGLSIVRRLTEGMGGDISFESVPGEGTTFIITLPVLYTVERSE